MRTTTFIAFFMLAALGLTVRMDSVNVMADDGQAATAAADLSVQTLKIPDYTFPGSDLTNCYIIAGKSGQAMVVDPADQLEPLSANKLLVDRKTGVSTTISSTVLKRDYTVSAVNDYGRTEAVRNIATGKEYLYYDQFRTTGNYAPAILKALTDKKLTLKYIVITHGHLDHFGAVTYLQEKTGAQVLMHRADTRGKDGAIIPDTNTTADRFPKDSYRIVGLHTKIDRLLDDGDTIAFDDLTFKVIHTPGHSPGSICLYAQGMTRNTLLSGDTLMHWYAIRDLSGEPMLDEGGNPYIYDTGRTNFSDGSGDEKLLYRTVREKLLTLPENTDVYPGHNEVTSIKEEKKYSPARLPGAE